MGWKIDYSLYCRCFDLCEFDQRAILPLRPVVAIVQLEPLVVVFVDPKGRFPFVIAAYALGESLFDLVEI